MRTDTFDNIIAIVVSINRINGVRTLSHSNTWLWLLLSFLYKVLLIPCLYYAVYVNCSFEYLTLNDMSFFMVCATYMANTIIVFLSVLTTQILGWQHYKEMSRMRKGIAETEQSLMKLNIVIDHSNLCISVLIICIVTTLNASLYCLSYVHMGTTGSIELRYIFGDLLLNIMIYIGAMVVLDFTLHICWLERNFKQTNNLLKKLFIDDHPIEMENWNNKRGVSWLQKCLNRQFFCSRKITQTRRTRTMEHQLRTLDKINVLQQIRYIHLQLCIIMKLLNKIFDTPIMFHSIVVIHTVVINLYIIYINILALHSSMMDSMNLIFFNVLNTFYVWLRVAVTCYFCEKTAKEAKKIVHIIHVCTIHNTDVELKNELLQFCLQISFAEMDCENVHLFRLNDSFILQSMGGIFTYSLIMIQWSVSLGVFESWSNSTTFNQSY